MAQPPGLAAFPTAADSSQAGPRVADRLVSMVIDLGVTHAFGVIGGAVATFADALGKSDIDVVQTRHEAGAAFAAAEASLATGRPALVFTTTGPGLLNALNGLVAARWDGAKVIVISAATGPQHRRRLPVQETSAHTMPMDALVGVGPWFDFGCMLESSAEIPSVETTLALGFSRPGGFVAHVAVPTPLQGQPAPPSSPQRIGVTRPRYAADIAEAVVAILADGPWALWLGYGARGAVRQVRALVDAAQVPVMSSPRAKGIVDERHPLYLGVTGAGGHDNVARELAAIGIKRTLVLGSRLAEATSFYDAQLIPPGGLIHVDVDRRIFGASFPDVETVGIEAEIAPFLDEVLMQIRPQRLSRAPQAPWTSASMKAATTAAMTTSAAATLRVHPVRVMQSIQRVVVDNSDAIVMAESGNAFGWANHHLCFSEAGRYRSSAAWGSMGHMVAGCIGAAHASGRRVVVITGDGAMLMNNEVNTAVQLGLPVTWVVLNDAGYGIVRDGMQALSLSPFGCDFPETDFAGFGRAQGGDGCTVSDVADLDMAIRAGLSSGVPYVVDVKIMRGEMSPAFMQRNRSLNAGAKKA